MGMKYIEVTYKNLDKPNKNGRFYKRELIDDALRTYCEKPLYLIDRMPSCENSFDSNFDENAVIGVGIKSEWLDLSTLKHTFKITKKDVPLDGLYPCMFGQGDMNSDGEVESFELSGFALCDTCAYEAEVRIIEE